MQFTRVMKVILTYDYWICGPSLSQNLSCKKYQIHLFDIMIPFHPPICLILTAYQMQVYLVIHVHVHAWETYAHTRVNLYEMSTYKPVEGDQFLNSQHAWACSDMVAKGIVFEIRRLCQMYAFPDQMNWQFVLIIASNLPSQPSSPLTYNMNVSCKVLMDWSYRKPYVCLPCNFLEQYSANGKMFNFCEYVCTKELLISGNNKRRRRRKKEEIHDR